MHDPTRTPDDDARLVAKLLTIADVAKLSGLSDKSVRRAIERGDLRALKLCNRLRIEPAAVADYHRRNPGRFSSDAALADHLRGAARRRAFRLWLERRRTEVVQLAPGYEHPGDPRQPDNTHRH